MCFVCSIKYSVAQLAIDFSVHEVKTKLYVHMSVFVGCKYIILVSITLHSFLRHCYYCYSLLLLHLLLINQISTLSVMWLLVLVFFFLGSVQVNYILDGI